MSNDFSKFIIAAIVACIIYPPILGLFFGLAFVLVAKIIILKILEIVAS